MKYSSFLLAAGLLLAGARSAHAQAYVWFGNGLNDNWSQLGNWQGGAFPASSAGNVYFQNNGVYYSEANLDYSTTITYLVFENYSSFTLTASPSSILTIANNGIVSAYYPGSVIVEAPIQGGTTANPISFEVFSGTSLTLTAATPNQNTYTGATDVFSGGTLTDGAPDSFSANSALFVGGSTPGTVNVQFNETVAGLDDYTGGPGTVNIASSTVLTIAGGNSNTYSGYLTGTGTLSSTATGTQILSGNSPGFTGTLSIGTGSAIQIGSGGTSGSVAATTVTGLGSLSFDRTDSALNFAGQILGGLEVVQNGSGVTTLSGDNSYSGGTVVNTGGTLTAGSSTAFGTGAVTLNSGTLNVGAYSLSVASLASGAGGILQLGTGSLTLTSTGANTTFGGAIHGSGALTVDQLLLSLTGNSNDYSGGTTINGTLVADNNTGSAVGTGSVHISSGGTLQIGNVDGNGNISPGAGIYDYGTLTFARGSNIAFTNVIVGTGGLDKYETSTLTLSAASNSGPTTIFAGTLTDAQANALSSTSDVTIGQFGTLAVAYDEVIGSLQDTLNSGGVAIATGTTLSSNGQNYTSDFSGAISGGGTFVVAAGVQGLSGNNTYTGGTVIAGTGELFVGSDSAIGTGTLTFTGSGPEMSPDANVTLSNNIVLDATFDNDDGGNNSMTLTGTISGAGEIEWCAPGTLTLSGNNSFIGGVDMREGNLILSNNNAAGLTGSITLNSGTSVTVQNGVTISNPLNVTASGPGTTLEGNGTFASPVTVGTYVTVAASAAPGGGPGTLTFSNGLTLANGGTITLSLYDATGAAGTGYSLASATGGLSITASGGAFAVNVVSIDSAGNSAAAINFSPYSSYSWKFATSSTAITGFTSSAFTVSNGLLNSTLGGTFSVSETGNSLFVDFTPVPEPATWALIGLGGFGALAVGVSRKLRSRG